MLGSALGIYLCIFFSGGVAGILVISYIVKYISSLISLVVLFHSHIYRLFWCIIIVIGF